jgi:hypothetical protein
VGKLPYANAASEGLRIMHRAMVIAPVVALVSFGYGVSRQSALETFSEPYQLELKQGIKINRIILRTFDKGVLVHDPAESRVEFIKWDELQKLSRFSVPESKVPPSCDLLGINCPRPSTSP